MTPSRRWGIVASLLGAVVIAGLTLHPEPDAAVLAASTPLSCLVCGDRGGVDVVLNLLLFLPLGLGLRLAGLSWRRSVAAGALGSLAIELLQLTVVPGRDASLSDLLSNSAGTAIGAVLAPRLDGFLRPGPGAAWRLFLSWSAAVLALLSLWGWLQSPWLGDGGLTSTWGGGPGGEAYPGQVRSVRGDGIAMPVDGVPAEPAAVRAALRAGRTSVETEVLTGPPVRGRRWVYVLGEDGHPRLFLSQQNRSAVFGMPARALRFRLNPPTVVLPEAFPGTPGVEVTLRAGQRDRRVWLASSFAGASRGIELILSPAHGWALLAPYSLGLGRSARLITAAILFGLVLPLGYWAAAARSGSRAAIAVGAMLVLGLAAVPAVLEYPPVHWSEWLAGATAAAAGWALHRTAAYLQLRCGSPSTSESSSF